MYFNTDYENGKYILQNWATFCWYEFGYKCVIPAGMTVDSAEQAGGRQVFVGERECEQDSASGEPPWWSPEEQMDSGHL